MKVRKHSIECDHSGETYLTAIEFDARDFIEDIKDTTVELVCKDCGLIIEELIIPDSKARTLFWMLKSCLRCSE
jgi:transcription initiation factor TFIIIB Brf1 subunit/transcription initiation factor TFIIB